MRWAVTIPCKLESALLQTKLERKEAIPRTPVSPYVGQRTIVVASGGSEQAFLSDIANISIAYIPRVMAPRKKSSCLRGVHNWRLGRTYVRTGSVHERCHAVTLSHSQGARFCLASGLPWPNRLTRGQVIQFAEYPLSESRELWRKEGDGVNDRF